ncbi:MAG: MBL fold metallo-hydrolase [Aestuariivita sp.]|nr:MBL fold metallo-hydrolase [Aestuariivita sp.]
MSDYVALLGTKGGPAIRPGSTMPTSNLLCLNGRQIVVDCGLGVSRGLVDQGMALKDLSLIFITHLHSDHYLELGPLLHTAWTAGLNTVVDVYGPADLDRHWAGFLTSMQSDIDLRIEDEGRPDIRDLVVFHVIDQTDVVRLDDMHVTSFRNIHPPLVDTFALSFKTDKTHVVFGGDTAYMPELAEFAKGAHLLIHEAMLEAGLLSLVARVGNGDDRLLKHLYASHTPAVDAARIATLAGVKALALNHLIPSDDLNFTADHWRQAVEPEWSGPLYLGSDGLRIELN